MKKEQEQDPVLFAGNKFYDQLMKSFDMSRQAMITEDYVNWARVLRQIYNWVSWSIKDKEILRDRLWEAYLSSTRISTTMRIDSRYRGNSRKDIIELNKELCLIEEELHVQIKPLIIKQSEKDDKFGLAIDEDG